jgi:integrase
LRAKGNRSAEICAEFRRFVENVHRPASELGVQTTARNIMRKPKPFYRKQTGSWYIELADKQHNLGVKGQQCCVGKDCDCEHRDKALEAAGALRKELKQKRKRDQIERVNPQVAELIDAFLLWVKANQKPRTFQFYDWHLSKFKAWIVSQPNGRLAIRSLSDSVVESWLAKCYGDCGPNYRLQAVRTIVRVGNWAKQQKLIRRNPIKGIKRPKSQPRKNTYIQPADLKRALAAAGVASDALLFLKLTGCRPKEMRDAEARHFDPQGKCLEFPADESKGEQEPRTILLDDDALAMIQRLALKYPAGPLFRNEDDNGWTCSALNCACRRIELKTGEKDSVPQPFKIKGVVQLIKRGKNKGKVQMRNIKKVKPGTGIKISPYRLRHTWATDAAVAGKNILLVAKLMGHKDLTMLNKVYARLEAKSDDLRAALIDINKRSA